MLLLAGRPDADRVGSTLTSVGVVTVTDVPRATGVTRRPGSGRAIARRPPACGAHARRIRTVDADARSTRPPLLGPSPDPARGHPAGRPGRQPRPRPPRRCV